MSLLNKVRASQRATEAAKVRVATAKVVAAASSKTIEEQLAEEGLAVLNFSSVGEDRYGNDAPLFVDEYTNPAPGTQIIWDARDQVAQDDADESADFRRAYPTAVTACDDRWEAYISMFAEIALAGRSAYNVWKHCREVVDSQRLAIFGGKPEWDNKLKVWKFAHPSLPGNIVASASDERLPLTAGHLRALKAHALNVGGHGCMSCESLEGSECWDHQALTNQGKAYADYLLRRKEQALKVAPVRAFTDLPEVVEEIIPGIRSRGPAVRRRKGLFGPKVEGRYINNV